MDWDKLRVFNTVAQAGSFTKATDVLNISQSAISRQISILEDEVGTPLFKRVARGLVLTESGKSLRDTVSNVFAMLATAQADIAELKNIPRGEITLSTSVSFGSLWLTPRLQEFLEAYPDIRLSVLLKDGEIDLTMREADIAITALPMTGSELIHSEPIPYRFRIYASREYLKKHGTPQKPEDLDHHRLLVFDKDMPHLYSDLDWLLKVGAKKPRIPYLAVNSAQALLEEVKGGVGIAALHKYIVGDDTDIIEILPEVNESVVNRYIVYPKHLESLKRMQVLVDFLIKKMKEQEF